MFVQLCYSSSDRRVLVSVIPPKTYTGLLTATPFEQNDVYTLPYGDHSFAAPLQLYIVMGSTMYVCSFYVVEGCNTRSSIPERSPHLLLEICENLLPGSL